MNLLNKLTIKNLKLNKKRTVVTIIGIMLSVALITAVATMYSSMIKSLISFETFEKGNFHVAYYDVEREDVIKIKNTREVEDVYLTSNIGYAKLEKSKNEYKPYAFIKGFTKKSLEELSVKLINGRLPENENEILIPSHLKTNGRVVLNIGDTISLDVGKRVDSKGNELRQRDDFQVANEDGLQEKIIDTTKKEYTIVGIIERPSTSIEAYTAPGYTFITYMAEENMSNQVDAFAKYSKKGSKEYAKVTASILEVDEESFTKAFNLDPNILSEDELNKIYKDLAKAKYQYQINTYLITLENNPLSESTTGSLGIVVVIVIIIILVTSVFCIKNSFDISISEKIKQYGMLRSIGATKKQIKNNVFYEATILGIIGIPLGLLCGFIASYILVIICNILLADMMSKGLKILLSYSVVAFAISLILGFVTIYLSAFRSAIKASKVSPIDSIRNSASIKIKAKKVRSPKIIRKIFKVGGEISYKNIKRNKKKYRTTTISIIVSVSVFIALSFFIGSAFGVLKEEVKMYDYNISLHHGLGNKSFEEKANNTTNLNNIEDYAVHRTKNLDLKSPKYNSEFITLGGYRDDFVKRDGNITIVCVGDYQYKKYLKSLNLDYNEFKYKGILSDYEKEYYVVDGKDYSKVLRKYAYEKGSTMSLSNNDLLNLDIEVGYITKEQPFGQKYGNSVLIVSDEIFNSICKDKFYEYDIYYNSTNPDKLQDDIDEFLQGEEYNLNNVYENAKIMKNLYTLIAIFLYGFIIVITLIGITNIFNTITTNMELRKQEFAMLKSIGMTKHEFNNMIRFESIFIGFKALLFGIPIGVGLSYVMYLALNMNLDGAKFNPPILAIILSIIVVYLLITLLMKYSMNKINKQNTIETIRNENI